MYTYTYTCNAHGKGRGRFSRKRAYRNTNGSNATGKPIRVLENRFFKSLKMFYGRINVRAKVVTYNII